MKTKIKKYRVCSDKHFENLLKQFKKITIRIFNERSYSKYNELYQNFLFSNQSSQIYSELTPFNNLLNEMLSSYKRNPFKTKCGFDDVMCYQITNKFWVTYTLEDENNKRSKTPTNIIFRVFVKIGYLRKKNIVRWVVPITWNYTL